MTTKDDRVLLEAAARAAGQPIEFTNDEPVAFIEDGVLVPPWNPLEDDGDALRLAVKLGISIVHRRTLVSDNLIAVAAARWADDYDDTETMYEGDPYAATRRAIVRAAASMAKERE